MVYLLFFLVPFPLIVAPLLLLPSQGPLRWLRRYAALIVTAAALACAMGLLFFGEQDIYLPITWLPGAGPWSLHIGGVGLYAAITTLTAALAAQVANCQSGRSLSPLLNTIFLIAIGSGNAAFLAGHFLARYLALEIVALCVAAACLVQLRGDIGTRAAGFVYLMLRVGDAGLLGAILLLLDAGGTLNVTQALQAGMALSGMPLIWVVVGLGLAVWVKAGIWPFHHWQRVGLAFSAPLGVWLHVVLMPQLGLYLLYRIAPLLASSQGFQIVFIALGLGSVAVIADRWMHEGDMPSAIAVYGGALLGSLGIACAAVGYTTGITILLLAGAPLRLWAALKSGTWDAATVVPQARLQEVAVVFRDTVEEGVFARGPVWAARALMSGAHMLHRSVEQTVFGEGPGRLTDTALSGARELHETIEQGGFEGVLRGVPQTVLALSRGVQRLHTGKLRMGLLWVVLSLLAVILLARAQ